MSKLPFLFRPVDRQRCEQLRTQILELEGRQGEIFNATNERAWPNPTTEEIVTMVELDFILAELRKELNALLRIDEQ